MSKKNNVNPDHYKIAGRERQGEDIIHGVYKHWYTQSKSRANARARDFVPGAQEQEYVIEAEMNQIAETERRIDEAHRKRGRE